MPHRRHTRGTLQSYSPDGANVLRMYYTPMAICAIQILLLLSRFEHITRWMCTGMSYYYLLNTHIGRSLFSLKIVPSRVDIWTVI